MCCANHVIIIKQQSIIPKLLMVKFQSYIFVKNVQEKKNEFEFDTAFSFHKLLTGLIDNIQSETMEKDLQDIVCSFCGSSYSKFKQTGKFGCPECYNSFKSKLSPLFKGIHGHNEHIGKVPERGNQAVVKKREITKLREELEELVAIEAFEKAAVVRDKINALEKELEEKRGGDN